MTEPLTAEHLVHVGLGDGVLLVHGVAQHVSGGVLRGEPHLLEPPVAPHLTVGDALHEVAGDAVTGRVLTAVLV